MNFGDTIAFALSLAPSKALKTSLLAGSAAILLSGQALAQSETPPDISQTGVESLETVVVTAEKRTERLQDVPSAVTAVTAGDLQNLQINDSTSLLKAVPSLDFQQGANPQNSSLRIRGIGTSLFGVGTTSDVVTIIDGVSVAKNAQNYFNFNDIQRVEVLRGPQVTLFGDGASAGAINVVSEKPTDTFKASGNATIAQDSEYRTGVTLSGPVTDNVKARVSGYYNYIDGTLDERSGGTMNGFKDWGFHGIVDWSPMDALTIQAGITLSENHDRGTQSALVYTQNPTLISLLGITPGPSNHLINDDKFSFVDSFAKVFSVQADYDLGDATITAITGYQYFNLTNNAEPDTIYNGGTALGLPVYVGCTKATSANCQAEYNLNGGAFSLKQFSQELRIANNGNEKLNYVAGAYYQTMGVSRPFARARAWCAAGTLAQLGTPCTATEWDSYSSYGYIQDTSISGFGQLDYRIFDQLKALFGFRVQNETVSASGAPLGIDGTGLVYDPTNPGPGSNGATIYKTFGGVTPGRESINDTMVGGKVGLQYEFNDHA
jgi:iron complex outermembrane receptor protein